MATHRIDELIKLLTTMKDNEEFLALLDLQTEIDELKIALKKENDAKEDALIDLEDEKREVRRLHSVIDSLKDELSELKSIVQQGRAHDARLALAITDFLELGDLESYGRIYEDVERLEFTSTSKLDDLKRAIIFEV